VHHARQNNMTLIKACERNNRFRSLVSYSQLQAKPHSVKLVTQTCPTLGLAATTCCRSKAPVNAPLNSSGPGASALVCRAAPVPEQFPGQHAHRALLLSVDGKALQHFINDLYQPSTHFQAKATARHAVYIDTGTCVCSSLGLNMHGQTDRQCCQSKSSSTLYT